MNWLTTEIWIRCGVARALLLLALVSFQSLADVTSLVVDPLSPNTVYAGTSEGGVLNSTDGVNPRNVLAGRSSTAGSRRIPQSARY